MELINCNNARVFCCFFLLSLFLDALVHWLVTLLDFHCFDVFGPLQNVHRAITNSFQIFIFQNLSFQNVFFKPVFFQIVVFEVYPAFASSKLCVFFFTNLPKYVFG